MNNTDGILLIKGIRIVLISYVILLAARASRGFKARWGFLVSWNKEYTAHLMMN